MDNDRSSDVQIAEMRPGFADRVQAWKSRSGDLVHDVRRSISNRTRVMSADLKRTVRAGGARMMSMIPDPKANPLKWAGIATGTSFLLGMIGREWRHRRYHRAMA